MNKGEENASDVKTKLQGGATVPALAPLTQPLQLQRQLLSLPSFPSPPSPLYATTRCVDVHTHMQDADDSNRPSATNTVGQFPPSFDLEHDKS